MLHIYVDDGLLHFTSLAFGTAWRERKSDHRTYSPLEHNTDFLLESPNDDQFVLLIRHLLRNLNINPHKIREPLRGRRLSISFRLQKLGAFCHYLKALKYCEDNEIETPECLTPFSGFSEENIVDLFNMFEPIQTPDIAPEPNKPENIGFFSFKEEPTDDDQ